MALRVAPLLDFPLRDFLQPPSVKRLLRGLTGFSFAFLTWLFSFVGNSDFDLGFLLILLIIQGGMEPLQSESNLIDSVASLFL